MKVYGLRGFVGAETKDDLNSAEKCHRHMGNYYPVLIVKKVEREKDALVPGPDSRFTDRFTIFHNTFTVCSYRFVNLYLTKQIAGGAL